MHTVQPVYIRQLVNPSIEIIPPVAAWLSPNINNAWLMFLRNTVNVIITCSIIAFIPHEMLIGDKLLRWNTSLNCAHLGNLYIALWFDQHLRAIFKNKYKCNNELWFCIKTTSNKIVHYSAICTVHMSKLSFRVFELLIHGQKSFMYFLCLVVDSSSNHCVT